MFKWINWKADKVCGDSQHFESPGIRKPCWHKTDNLLYECMLKPRHSHLRNEIRPFISWIPLYLKGSCFLMVFEDNGLLQLPLYTYSRICHNFAVVEGSYLTSFRLDINILFWSSLWLFLWPSFPRHQHSMLFVPYCLYMYKLHGNHLTIGT